MIKRERAKAQYMLVLDAGNSLVGDRDPARRTKGETSVEAMNLLGYDAMALGRKDLALGLDVLRQRMAEAQFPMLSANAVLSGTDELIAEPYIIKEMGGHQIAIIGLTGGKDTAEVQIRPPLTTARQVVAELTPQADIIIILSHAGLSVDRQIAQEVSGVDLIISGGREHPKVPVYDPQRGVLVVHADVATRGHAGRRIGIAYLKFDSQGRLIHQKWVNKWLDDKIPDDPDIAAWARKQR